MKIRTVAKYLKPKYLWKNRLGFCTVCGKQSIFLLSDKDELIRNHALCVRCTSCSRHRHLALCILEEFAGHDIRHLSDFRGRPELSVFNTSTGGSVAKALGRSSNIVCSEYFDDVKPGEARNGILCQDLHNLTFADGSFDLVLSEDVFEHLPDYRKAFREVHRVLRKSGKHLFTIPYFFDRKTRDLFAMENGKPVLFKPIEYHGDHIRGLIPCYTHFGFDLLDFLGEVGFNTRIVLSSFSEQRRFATFDSFTFITTKI